MSRLAVRFFLAAVSAVAFCMSARAEDAAVLRGKFLVTIAGCSDCHTPGHFLGHADMARYLGGSDVGFATPGGVFVGPNLTPDAATGLGNWTSAQIVTAMTTGERPDGRVLAPIMPWRNLAELSGPDALAIAAYLKSLPAVSNAVPGPFGPGEAPTVFVMSVLPGAVYAGLPKPH